MALRDGGRRLRRRRLPTLSSPTWQPIGFGESDGDRVVYWFTIAGRAPHFGIEVPTFASALNKPWWYLRPADEDESSQMLNTFIQEEIDTGAADWAAATISPQGVRFELAPYGFRRKDEQEHARLLLAAGSFGWHGSNAAL